MNKYVCHYDNSGDEDSICEGTSLFDFKDGFWIDGEGKFTKDPFNGVYWIPPSRIYYVEKVEIEET